jgi:hypothetical protein
MYNQNNALVVLVRYGDRNVKGRKWFRSGQPIGEVLGLKV